MTEKVHVHIITPNTSAGFRDDTPLHRAVGDLCRLSSSFLDKGPASVESAVDEVLAGPGTIDAAVRAEKCGADAIVIDCMLDPALDAVREAVSIPVIGAGSAGFAAAASFGQFCVVAALCRQAPMFEDLVMRNGLSDKLTSVKGIEVPVLELEQDREGTTAKTIAACKAAMDEGANAVVFGCTGMLGFAEPVAEALGVRPERITDPLPNAVKVALAAVEQGFEILPAPERKPVQGYEAWADLHALMLPES